MFRISLNELREQELPNIDKVSFDVASRAKGIMAMTPNNIFGIAYLSYLVADNGIENIEELKEYVETELPLEQSLFIKDCVGDSWSVAIDLGYSYTIETLVATLLWMPLSSGRFGAE